LKVALLLLLRIAVNKYFEIFRAERPEPSAQAESSFWSLSAHRSVSPKVTFQCVLPQLQGSKHPPLQVTTWAVQIAVFWFCPHCKVSWSKHCLGISIFLGSKSSKRNNDHWHFPTCLVFSLKSKCINKR
jgi:hypothetical protein